MTPMTKLRSFPTTLAGTFGVHRERGREDATNHTSGLAHPECYVGPAQLDCFLRPGRTPQTPPLQHRSINLVRKKIDEMIRRKEGEAMFFLTEF